MSIIEIIATLFGLACVWLYVRQSIWSWPTGLVQVILFAWVFFTAKLYSDFLLHLIYIVLQIYGWYHWTRGTDLTAELPITPLSSIGWGAWITTAVLGTATLGFVMYRFTDASLPYWDASIAVLSLIAQFLLTRKILENWLFWIVVDVVAIGVYVTKELYVTTGLYSVFLCLAIMGWVTWRKSYRKADSKAVEVLSSENSFRPTVGISS